MENKNTDKEQPENCSKKFTETLMHFISSSFRTLHFLQSNFQLKLRDPDFVPTSANEEEPQYSIATNSHKKYL